MMFRSVLTKVSNIPKILVQVGHASRNMVLKFTNDHVVPEAKAFVRDAMAGSEYSTGLLESSIHSAPENYAGYDDYDAAADDDFITTFDNATVEDVAMGSDGVFVLVAGSWLPYACVIENGEHVGYMSQAIDTLGGTVADTMAQAAFREAGL